MVNKMPKSFTFALEGITMSVQNIYFDESGFTGENLLSKDQEFFAYGSVACGNNISEYSI